MDATERQAAVNRFQRDPSIRVFGAQMTAMGVGYTMTAATLIVFFEEDWSPGVLCQMEDRLHRIGQRDSVLAVYLVLEGSIGATMLKRVISKMEVIDKALDRVVAPKSKEEAFKAFESREPIVGSSVSMTREQLADESVAFTPERCDAVLHCLGVLASCCDGARTRDGAGFNGVDSRIGKDLAGRLYLSPKQAALGARIARKYRTQLESYGHSKSLDMALGKK